MRLIDYDRLHEQALDIIGADASYKAWAILSAIDNAPIIERPEPRWIPCSERLPKEYGNYLITTHNGDVDVGTIDPKKKGVWSACDADGFYWIREVVAWMPLPKGYKGE